MSRGASFRLFLPLLLTLAGCAGPRQSAAPVRLAVLPLRAVGLDPSQTAAVRSALGADLVRRRLAVVAEVEVDRALAASPGCREPGPEQLDRCALHVGASLAVTHVLDGAVGGVGRALVVQLRLVRLADASVRTLEESLLGDLATLQRTVGPLAGRLIEVDTDVSGSRAWYRRWWVWTLVGAVAAGVAVGVAVPLARRGEGDVAVPLP